MVGASYLELKREALASRVYLLPTRYDDSLPSNAPDEHKQKFRCVQFLGSQLFDTYRPQPSMTSEPWQEARKAAATYIYRGAEKCRRENRNESGWRTEVEHRIFQRFDIEVTCPKCSRRLWRSEIETEPAWSHNLLSLNRRQQCREPCTCNPTSRKLDFDDIGTRDVFTTRVEEFVPSERAIPDSGKPIKLKPDRIVGLNCTLKFEKLLDSFYIHGDGEGHKPVRDVVRTTINSDNGGSPLLFPFLVLEAKAEKGVDGFEHMEVQSALPVMEALRIQYELMTTTGNTVDIPGGPLVWFFANRGEYWRVYAGYVVESDGLPYYYVVCLWGGCVTDRNQALQILLITDCIVDWARDTFRPSIRLQLKMLGTTNSDNLTSLLDDEDIYSIHGGATDKWIHDRNVERLNEEDQGTHYWDQLPNEMEQDNIQHLDKFVTADGVVRDARRIDSHLLGIIITEANFPTFLASFDTEAGARGSSREILKILNQRYLVLSNQKALDKIEHMWTGHTRCAYDEEVDEDERVFVQTRVSYFIDLDWHQVRQLNYLAVTAKALPLLYTCAEIRQPLERPSFGSASSPHITEEYLWTGIQTLLERTVRDFHGATHRLSLSLHEADTVVTLSDDNEFMRTTSARRVQVQVDTDKDSPGPLLEGLVHSTHERFRVGRLFLDQTFLASSSRVDFNTRILWKGYQDGDKLPDRELGRGTRLACGPCPKVRPHQLPCEQNFCMYILDGTKHTLDSMLAVMGNLPYENMYVTCRTDRTSSPAARRTLDGASLDCDVRDPMKMLELPSGCVVPADILGSWRIELWERARRRGG